MALAEREWGTCSSIALRLAQACGLASAADAASQAALLGTVDPHHVAAMGTLAFTVSGSLNALWLQFLEEKTPGASFQACASKTACDFACCATLFNSAYLGFVPVLTALYAGVAFDEAWALLEAAWALLAEVLAPGAGPEALVLEPSFYAHALARPADAAAARGRHAGRGRL